MPMPSPSRPTVGFFESPRSSSACSYPAIELFQNRVAVLVALLVVAHDPELFCREAAETPGDLLHGQLVVAFDGELGGPQSLLGVRERDRKSTRLNSSHANISYAVFCLKTKTI